MASPETPILEAKDEAEAFIVQPQSPNPSVEYAEVEAAVQGQKCRDSQQWSMWYKRYLSVLVSVVLFITVTLISEALSFFANDLAEEFKLNATLVNLTITNFSICFCLGPLLWCPLSEHYGRRPVYLLCFNGFTVSQVCAAVSQNAASLVIFRSLSGFFGSACLPLAVAVLFDSWEVEISEREIGSCILNMIAPSSGVLFGAFLAQKGFGWRETSWLLAIITGLCTVLVILTLRETRRPILAKFDEPADGTPNSKEASGSEQHAYYTLGSYTIPKASLWRVIAKPYVLLWREPVLIISAVYLAMIGASTTIFLRVSAVALLDYTPAVQLIGGIAILIGNTVGIVIHNHIIYPRFYLPKVRAVAPDCVQPEVRLTVAAWAAPLFAACFIWFGWTLSPRISVAVPLIASPLLGMSAQLLMQVMFNYIIDVYEDTVATAVAWCTVLMYALITVFTVCSPQVFGTLSVCWIMTLVGGVAVALVPVPMLLTRYGPFLRAISGRIR
ncbi:MFS general substrate transporter [Polyporus arcularius HHB13444]|uniref:MFS general substrate transporter n=1 Tax=Polyporus arcularius HHB13444 TaxID=1314778 RepID=A0A5C3PJE4_9APHY|nr:MFS general substrate transporter [Polyporus arcularius HHB13444]